MQHLRAQASLEFLFSASLVTLIFIITIVLYTQSQADTSALSSFLESQRLCRELAAQIATVDAAGPGTNATLVLSPALSNNYSFYLSGPNRSISVSFGTHDSGCPLSTSNISNGTSANFTLGNARFIQNLAGGVRIG